MNLKDERDAQDEHEEIGRLRNIAMEMLQELSDANFIKWWHRHHIELTELAERRFATATLYHEEPCYEADIPF